MLARSNDSIAVVVCGNFNVKFEIRDRIISWHVIYIFFEFNPFENCNVSSLKNHSSLSQPHVVVVVLKTNTQILLASR